MSDTDIAIRCNIVTLSEENCAYEERTIVDHSAGEISTQEAAELIGAVREVFENDEFSYFVGTSYRHLLIWKQGSVVELTPPHDVLGQKIDPQAIQYVIANCSECEPYLTSDYRRLMEEPERIVLGLKIVLKLFPNATGLFGVEDNKMDAAVKLRALTQDDPRFKVCICKSKYPQGAERQLIKALTGRELNSTKLPADVGCIVLNVDTLYSITRAVCEGRPLLHRIVTVTGDAIEKPQNFAVRIGTSYEELVEQAGGFAKEPVRIVSGGPMMGNALPDLKVPVMKASSALLCMTRDETEQYSPTACIRCGRCLDACPEHLMPTNLAELALRWDREGFLKLNGMECIECGSCSYVCPAGRRLAHAIKAVRRTIIEERRR